MLAARTGMSPDAWNASRDLGPYRDRHDAGRELARRLQPLGLERPVVLALPRGGVPVGVEIARALQCPIDVLLVRKLGAPGFPELGLGAIVDGTPPQRVLNPRVIEAVQPPPGYLEDEEARQRAVLAARREHLRHGRAPQPVAGCSVVLVDDGIATGGTMRAALQALQSSGASRRVVAVPVAPANTAEMLGIPPQDLVCPLQPEDFQSVGAYYQDFEQVDDAQVLRLLEQAWHDLPSNAGRAAAAS